MGTRFARFRARINAGLKNKEMVEIMTISSATKVRDVALQLPQSTRLFEKLKIDYCCGGDQPLADACATVGVYF